MSTTSIFVPQILERARSRKKRLALPEGDDPRALQAARDLLDQNAVQELWLYGNMRVIKNALGDVSDSRITIIDSSDAKVQKETRLHFAQRALAKGKALPEAELDTLSTSVLNQAAMHLSQGFVDAVVAGCAHTTAEVIRASLRGVGLKPGLKTLSSSFVMVRGSEILVYGDCGVVADPSPEQLSDIAQSTAETFALLLPEDKPRIAFLSFSTKGSADHPRVERVRRGFEIFREKAPELAADGELQFDAAYVPDVGTKKAPGSPVAGRANCFIFPDLDSGNIGYKITQRLGGFEAYGPLLQGGAKPYLDLSRGANAKDIMVSGLLALLMA